MHKTVCLIWKMAGGAAESEVDYDSADELMKPLTTAEKMAKYTELSQLVIKFNMLNYY